MNISLFNDDRPKGRYNRCNKCGSRVALVTQLDQWQLDDEPFAEGERGDANLPFSVTTGIELTGHYCIKCNELTTLTINIPE